MPRTLNLALIPGDGIGTEVVAEAVKVLSAIAPAADLDVRTTEYDLGARRYNATGELLPDAVVEELRGYDAILLGAIGDPSVAPGILERGVLLPLRFVMDHHVNLRPVKLYPGVTGPLAGKGPEEIDFVVCREGTEGPYVGAGGTLRKGTPHEVSTEVSINTAFGAERIIRDAFERAMRRNRKVTLVHKTNVLVHAGQTWQQAFDRVKVEYPEVETDYCHVDAASMFFLTNPERFDVIVTDNLFGDILTDIGAAIGGGIGLAASGNIDPSRTNPSMFEPVHGSAPDIAGQGKADPTATVMSLAMLLDHVGEATAAALGRVRRGDRPVHPRLRRPQHLGDRRCTRRRCRGRLEGVVSCHDDDRHRHRAVAHHHQPVRPSGAVGRARGDPRRPGLRRVVHRPHGAGDLDGRRRLARRPARGLRPARRSTRPPTSCTTARPSSRASRPTGTPTARSAPSGPIQNAERFANSARRLAMAELPDGAVPRIDRGAGAPGPRLGPERPGEVAVPAPVHDLRTEVGLGVRPADRVRVPAHRLARGRVLPPRAQAGQRLDLRRLRAGGTGRHRRGQVRGQLRRIAGRPGGGCAARLRPGRVARRGRAHAGSRRWGA